MAGSGHCDFLEANVKVFLLVFYAESSLEYSDGKRGYFWCMDLSYSNRSRDHKAVLQRFIQHVEPFLKCEFVILSCKNFYKIQNIGGLQVEQLLWHAH